MGSLQGQSTTSTPTSPADPAVASEIRKLSAEVAGAQAQVEASQRQIGELQRRIAELETRLAAGGGAAPLAAMAPPAARTTPPSMTTAKTREPVPRTGELEEIRERQEIQQAEIATHEQAKVESESKFPVKVTGMILLNAFVNTRGVDLTETPSISVPGGGTTGASLRQTILGLDARGPHVLGGRSRADVRVDFFGGASQGNYGDQGGLLRLRTAHAAIQWKDTEVFAELDRPILSPNAPSSLTAVAQPALSWSGNLWNWVPQVGATHTRALGGATHLRLQGALVDVPDPTIPGVTYTGKASGAELSRWPGMEARVALLGKTDGTGAEMGVSGYFSPHRTVTNAKFNAWAGAIDYRLPLPARFELSGSAYRGLGLGGLGAGGYKDYVYRYETGEVYTRALDDVGGWAQLKQRTGTHLEWNAAFGIDNVFASELRPYAAAIGSAWYRNLARNRTFYSNVIYSPTAYTLFSFEYRRIQSMKIVGPASITNVFGLAAGYRF